MYHIVDHPIPSLEQFREYLVSTYGEEQARAMTQSVAEAMSDIIKGGGELSRSKAGMITCPVLLIAGEHDIFAPPALVYELAARIHTAEMLVAKGVEQFVYKNCPEWLTHRILDWVRKHSGQSQNISSMR